MSASKEEKDKAEMTEEAKKQPEANKKQEEATKAEDDSLSGGEEPANSAIKSNGQRIMVPGATDVLLGRGKPFQSHQGNQLMLQLVDQFRAEYLNADRKGKHIIIEHVLSFIKERGGRFLMRVDYENYWVEVKQSISYRKVGHAFRSKARRAKPTAPLLSTKAAPTPALLRPAGLEMDLLAMNQAARANLGVMGGSPAALSANNPLLRLPARLPSSGPSSLLGQEAAWNEMLALERQQDALAMRRRQLQDNANNLMALNLSQKAILNPGLTSMDELLLLERMQQSQQAARGQAVLNPRLGAGLLANNLGLFGTGDPQSRFPNQFF